MLAERTRNKIGIIKSIFVSASRQFLMIFLSIVALYPIFFMVNTALKSKDEYIFNRFGFPGSIEWSNFSEIFIGRNFGLWFKNSSVLTVSTVILSLVIAIFAAFALSNYKFKMRNSILNFFISLMIIPPVVMIIPLFIIMVRINLINTYPGAIIIYTGLTLPFSIFLLSSFFRSIPRSVIESAVIDGCSSFRILTRMILPLSIPPIITLIVVNSLWVWNELLIALIFLQKDNLKTLIVGITVFKSRYDINLPLTMMGLIVVTLPILVLYLFGQKYFIKGLLSGSTKE